MEYTCPIKGYTIQLNLEKEKTLGEAAIKTISDRYLTKDEQYAQQAFARAACAFADDQDMAQRLYNYSSSLWFMFATPLLANGGTKAGQPISCFLSKVGDNIRSITENHQENAFLSVYGGGIGTDWSSVRSKETPISRGGKTPGVIPFITVVNAQVNAFQQGSTRRGSAAIYLDISHPEIEEFLEIRDHISGDTRRRCLNDGFHHGVNIPDAFMEALRTDEDWPLVDPHTELVIKTVKARELWQKLLQRRVESGEPFIHFSDTSNNALNPALKKLGLRINGSNLCNEIYLPTTPERTAVCCLSSINLEKWDEIENKELFVEDLLRMLDNALTVFIETAPKEMQKAVYSAKSERSVGLGAMGFHAYLQKQGVPFESSEARAINISIFSTIKELADKANSKLGKERGSPPDLEGTGMRFAHTMAIAPNATSSIICGNTSPSTEPFESNIYTQATLSGTLINKNKYLKECLQKYDKDTKEVWQSIILSKGSVQHLDFLPVVEKAIFKTARELNQSWIIQHASDRQPFIDQGQSLNIFTKADIKFSELHSLHMAAWTGKLKGMYYCHSESVGRVEKENKGVTPKPTNGETCEMCEG